MMRAESSSPGLTAPIEAMLARAVDDQPLDRDGAIGLALRAPLRDLLAAATALRALGKGCTVTFSKKVFIPLTTLCRDYCGYCTFRKDPGQPGAHFMTPDEVLALAEQGRRTENFCASRALRARSTILPPCANSCSTALGCCRTQILA
jgi:2-iminoacetate synthase ThiH